MAQYLILGVGLWVKPSDDYEVLRDIAMATIFGLVYMGVYIGTVPPGEYD